ncbi:MAG: AAA family ATPase, partial [Defluviitaleaceae bacterium]|nr:AAA family ATPase [Defluviitaleaceae bacterium]
MDKPHGIIVFGAGGTGKTTLACELARLLNFDHFDTDDYFFEQTDPPFTQTRSLNKRIEILRPLLKTNFIISGCLREWGGAFDSMLSMAVFLIVPTDIRIERLESREFNRNGKRIKQGGDLYNRHQEFIRYVATYDNGGMETRSLASQEAWAKTLTCPVIRVDGTIDWRINAV